MKKKTKKETSNFIFIIIIAVVGIFLYISTSSYGFVWDDNPLYLNKVNYPENNSYGNLHKFWTPGQMPMYAPVTYSIWAAIASFSPKDSSNDFGRSSSLFHITNFLIHILNSIILFLILLILFGKKPASFAGAMIFLVHPVNVESVAWISELRGLLSCFFGFLAILYYLTCKSKDDKNYKLKPIEIILLILLFILSFLSKPSGLVFPVIAVAVNYFFLNKSIKNNIIEYSAFGLITILLLVISVSTEAGASKMYDTSVITKLLLPFFSFIFYLLKVIIPVNLSAVYGMTPKYLESSYILTLYPFIFLMIIAILYFIRKEYNKIIPALVISFIAALPTSGIVSFYYQSFSNVADRYFYAGMMGIAIVVTFLLSKIDKPANQYSALVIITIILMYLSFNQIPNWQNEFSHWNNVILNSNIGIPQAYMGRGEANIKLGKLDNAVSDFTEAIKLNPKEPLYYYNRGNSFLDLKQYNKAIDDFTKSVELQPKNTDVYINRGIAYSELSDKAKAMADFNYALRLQPKQTDALNYIGVLFAQSSNFDSAYYYFKRAHEINPNDNQSKENLKNVEIELNKRRRVK